MIHPALRLLLPHICVRYAPVKQVKKPPDVSTRTRTRTRTVVVVACARKYKGAQPPRHLGRLLGRSRIATVSERQIGSSHPPI